MALKQYSNILNFSGGINANDGPTLIADNEVTDALNVVFGNGYAQKRFGYEQYGVFTPQGPISSLYEYKRNNGTKEFLVAAPGPGGNALYKDNGTSFDLISPPILTSTTCRYITYKNRSIQDVVLIADTGSLKYYDGATPTGLKTVTPYTPTGGELTNPGLNDLVNLTNVRAIALKKDRIFIAGHPTQKNRVHFSWIDPVLGYAVYDYFPAIYFFDVAVEDNDEIVELKVFRNQLIIFCKKSVWALKGDGANLTDLELVKINVPNGCISADSIQEVGNNIFYLGDDHVYSLFSSDMEFVSAQIMSMNVKPILKGIGLTSKIAATSVMFDNRYWLTFPGGLTLVYDSVLNCWTKFDNVDANSFLVRDGVLYFGAGNPSFNVPNHVYRFNENKYTDDGVVIDYLLRTKIYNFDLPVNIKKYRRMWAIQKQWDGFFSTYNLECMINQYSIVNVSDLTTEFNTGNSALWDQVNWDEASWDFTETTQNRINIRKKGKDIQFVVRNSKVDQPLSIYGFVVEYEVKKPK